jgi:hypothetical protein
VFRGAFIILNAYIGKEGSSKISSLIFYLGKVEED